MVTATIYRENIWDSTSLTLLSILSHIEVNENMELEILILSRKCWFDNNDSRNGGDGEARAN